MDLNGERDMQVARALGWTDLQIHRVFSRDAWVGRRPDGEWEVVKAYSTFYDPESLVLALQKLFGGLILTQYNPNYGWYAKWWKGERHYDAGDTSLRGALCQLTVTVREEEDRRVRRSTELPTVILPFVRSEDRYEP